MLGEHGQPRKRLTKKNTYILCYRVMAFIIGLPVGQIILFCISIGKDPIGLHLAIANHELDETFFMNQHCPYTKGCNYTNLSCRYIEILNNKTMITVR
jgi:hypothetical protein